MPELPGKLTAVALLVTLGLAVLAGAATTALLEDDEAANVSIRTGNVGGITVGNTQTNDVCAGNVDTDACTDAEDLGRVSSSSVSPQVEAAAKVG